MLNAKQVQHLQFLVVTGLPTTQTGLHSLLESKAKLYKAGLVGQARLTKSLHPSVKDALFQATADLTNEQLASVLTKDKPRTQKGSPRDADGVILDDRYIRFLRGHGAQDRKISSADMRIFTRRLLHDGAVSGSVAGGAWFMTHVHMAVVDAFVEPVRLTDNMRGAAPIGVLPLVVVVELAAEQLISTLEEKHFIQPKNGASGMAETEAFLNQYACSFLKIIDSNDTWQILLGLDALNQSADVRYPPPAGYNDVGLEKYE